MRKLSLPRTRRAARIPLLIMAALMVTVSCSSGKSVAGDIAQVRARLVEDGVGCHAKAAPYQAGPRAVDLGVNPTSTIECVVDGIEIQLTQYGSEADRRKAMGVSKAYLCSFGGTGFSYVTSAGWIATAQRPKTNVTDAAMLSQIADSSGGETERVVCPKGSGSVPLPGSADVQTGSTTTSHGGH